MSRVAFLVLALATTTACVTSDGAPVESTSSVDQDLERGTTYSNVRVVNSLSEPVPVTLMHSRAQPIIVESRNEPARRPFQRTFGLVQMNSYLPIPANTRLVIEHVSAQAWVWPGEPCILRIVAGVVGDVQSTTHHVSNARVTTLAGADYDICEISTPMRIYADGPDLRVYALSFNSSKLPPTFDVTISGYLIDMTPPPPPVEIQP